MSKKLSKSLPFKRVSTRSFPASKPIDDNDQYTFQSDDEDHQVKASVLRKSLLSKRPRGRPPKVAANRSSLSSSTSETEEKKRSYEKPVTRRASRLGSQTNSSVEQIREKIKINSTPPILISPKKRGRKTALLSTNMETSSTSEPTDNPLPTPSNKSAEPVTPSKESLPLVSSEQEEFSDDSVEFVWQGSSKASVEILKRRIHRDEPHDRFSSAMAAAAAADPTAQRKRAIIPRLTNFDALSGKPMSNDERATKTTLFSSDKVRPRVYAVKSTLNKSNSEIKRPKWMNEGQGKSEDDLADDDERRLSMSNEENPPDYDYQSKGQYLARQSNLRARTVYPNRRGTGMRGRPPGSRRHWTNDDDDDDYDQYEDTQTRYGPRKTFPYRSGSRAMYDAAPEDDDYEKTRPMSLTQTYRQPIATNNNNGNRRLPLNNGNHPMHKDENYYSQGSSSRSTTTTNNRLPTTTSTITSGNTFVAKINDAQLSEVANQSQIFFVNVPQQDQKNQQVLSVLASEQQQVLPVAVVQQAKVETPNTAATQNQTLAFTVKLPVETPKQKKILPKPSNNSNATSTGNASSSSTATKPFAWSRPPGRIALSSDEQSSGKALTITPINTDLDTMEAAHVLATAADVTMAADARRKAQQHDDDMNMMVDETPSNIANEETVQCEDEGQKNPTQTMGSITANIIDENGLEHTVILSTEEAQQLLVSSGAIFVDSDGQPLSIHQPQTQTFLPSFALDQAQLQAILTQAGLDPNTPLTIEQIDPNQQQQQQQMATLYTSPGGTQYTVLTQGPVQQQTQQQFILQTATIQEPAAAATPAAQPQPIAPKEELTTPPKRRAFAVKSTVAASEQYDEISSDDQRPRRKIFATKSSVTPLGQ